MRTTLRSGVTGLVAIAVAKWLDNKQASNETLAFVIVLGVVVVLLEIIGWEKLRNVGLRNRPMGTLIAFVVVGLIGALGWNALISNAAPTQSTESTQATPEEPKPKVPSMTDEQKPKAGLATDQPNENGPAVTEQKPPPKPEEKQVDKPENTKPPSQIISAPGGIAIGGGTVMNPTVNNYAPPPWRISPAGLTELTRAMTPFRRKVEDSRYLRAVTGDSDSIKFASEVVAALEAAGWEFPHGVPQSSFSGPIEGVVFLVASKEAFDNLPPEADALKRILNAEGIVVTGNPFPSIRPDDYRVVIGRRPR